MQTVEIPIDKEFLLVVEGRRYQVIIETLDLVSKSTDNGDYANGFIIIGK